MNKLPVQSSASDVFGRSCGPLGFGCAWLGRAGGKDGAVRLLHAAHDAGISYFDTARLYGDGVAEGYLADAFANRRDKVVITTKVGILPPPNGLAVRIKEKLAHTARKLPPARKLVAEPKLREPVFGVFDLPRMRASFEASLRELRTDYVDCLLLHECTRANMADPEVVGFVEGLKREGKIRAWGVAPTVAEMLAISNAGTGFGQVAQFANSAFSDALSKIKQPPGALVITHSSLAGGFRDLLERLKSADAAARWQAATGFDPSDHARLGRLFLRYALQRNEGGIVLFSTSQPARIAENVQVSGPNDAEREMALQLPAGLRAVGVAMS
ncbi:MAG: aldo/keto reductase [Burkholderiales bacterium]|nr:MAG: aldo/keto reductase [Burkholderiales bacterium]